jgi:predicted lipase
MELSNDLALKSIQASINSYRGEYGNWKPFLENPNRYKINHTEFDTGVSASILFICFQGSSGGKDWKDNLRFWKTGKLVAPFATKGDIRIHSGFYDQYYEVHDTIRDIVETALETEKIKGVVFCGHSLGGALATLAAVDIQFNYDVDIALLTFGSPRVGNKAFALSTNKRIPQSLRFVLRNDMVTKVPFLGFYHVDAEIRLGVREWYRPLAFLLGNPWDHYPEKYQDRLLAGDYQLILNKNRVVA